MNTLLIQCYICSLMKTNSLALSIKQTNEVEGFQRRSTEPLYISEAVLGEAEPL